MAKDKKKKRYCAEHRYRFRKVQIEIDDEGNVIRHHEGLLPRLERNLLATRKEIKREMAKADARLAMNRGKADAKAIEFYRDKCGYEIIEKGSLSVEEDKLLEIMAGILNAKQLAVKVSCNSMYGTLGARTGPIPLIEGAASVTAMGRSLIMLAIDRIMKEFKTCMLVYGDTDSCMIHFKGASLKQSFKL